MRPRTRNGLAVLALLLLIAGIVAALVHGKDDATKRPSTETAAQPAATTRPTTSPASPFGPATSVAPTTSPGATTPTTVAGATATTAMTRQPRTGGPGTLPVGLLLVAAGLVALRFHAAAVRAMGDLQAVDNAAAD